MTDAEYEAQKARVRALIERWVAPLGLGWWQITFEFERDSGQFKVDGVPSLKTVGCTGADWRYLSATIGWNVSRLPEFDDDKLEAVFVHELMHIFLNEFRALIEDGEKLGTNLRDDWLAHEEHTATVLSKAFIWVRDFAQKGEPPALSHAEAAPGKS